MLILYAILIASVGLSHLAEGSAIKGHAHARPQEEARSIKLASLNNLDKQVKVVGGSPVQQSVVPAAVAAPSVPILESTKKIYNDETIRRIAYAQQAEQQEQQAARSPSQPLVVPVQKEPTGTNYAPVVEPIVKPKESKPVEQVVQPVEQAVQPVVQAAPVSVPVPVQAEQAVISGKQGAPCSPKIPIGCLAGVEPVVPVQRAQAVPVPAQAQADPVSVVPKLVVEPVVKPVDQVVPVPVQAAPVSVPVLVQAEPVVVPVQKEQAPVAQVVPVPMVVAAPVPVKSASEELPPQSDRSAPLLNVAQQSAVPESVAAVQPVVVVPSQVVPVQSVEQVLRESQLVAKKDETVVPQVEPLHIEVPAPDPGLVLSEPIDSTTKLLIDLDEHVQKFLPAEDQQQLAQSSKDQQLVAGIDYSPANGLPAAQAAASPANPTGKSSGPLVPYSSSSADDTIVPPLPSLDGVEKASSASGGAIVSSVVAAASPSSSSSSSSSAASSPSATRQGNNHHNQNQQQVITQLLDQLDTLQNRIQDTMNQLVARRRYVMSALLRPMGTYVRRVRTNLERLQNRVNQLQAAASSVGGQNRPGGGFVDAAAIETIRRRIDDISKRISDIVNRIRFSLTPTSAPLNSNGRK